MPKPASNEPTDDEIDRIGPEFMTEREISLRIRDIIRDGLMVREHFEITTMVATERANNLAMAIVGEFAIKGRPRERA